MADRRKFEKIEARLNENAVLVNEELARRLAKSDGDFGVLIEAMRYSALGGGKRIRPFLTIEFCRLFGGDVDAALPFAAAVEMTHAFSLIHDDLPCMDDDDLRRGKPTNHKVYGEATALLAGDALAIAALGVCADNDRVQPRVAAKAVSVLASAAGSFGMIGGQVMDMLGEETSISNFGKLCRLHKLKTGAIIKAAAELGCLCAPGVGDAKLADALKYAENIGLAFQIIDDILDATGDEIKLGKRVGSDEKQNKTTFLSFMDIDSAKEKATSATNDAIDAISRYDGSSVLVGFAEYLLSRDR